MMYDGLCRDVACHVDSAICHPEELATKDLGNTPLYVLQILHSVQDDKKDTSTNYKSYIIHLLLFLKLLK